MRHKLLQVQCVSVAILVTLTVLHLPRAVALVHQPENESRKMNNVTVIYDVSSVINPGSEHTEQRDALSEIYSDSNGTANFYYETNVNTYKDACNETYERQLPEYSHNSCGRTYALQNISIIFNRTANMWDLQSITTALTPFRWDSINLLLAKSNPFLESVIISLEFNSTNCTCSSSIQKITNYFEMVSQSTAESSMTKRSVKLGLELSPAFIKCCHEHPFDILVKADHIILRIELTPFSTLLSYGLFSEMMDDIVPKYRWYVQKQKPYSTLHIRFVNKNSEDAITKASFMRYEALVGKFVNAWIQQRNSDDEVFIVHPHHKTVAIPTNIQFLRKSLMPKIYADPDSEFGQQAQQLKTEPKIIVKQMHSVFNAVLIVNPTLTTLKHISSRDNATFSILFTGPKTNLEEKIKIMNYSLNSSSILNINAVYLDCNQKSEKVKTLVSMLDSKKVKIGCQSTAKYYSNLKGNFQQETANFIKYNVKCSSLSHLSSSVLVRISLEIPTREDLIRFLVYLQQAKVDFESECPGKTLVPSIRFESLEEGSTHFSFKSGILPHSFYCNLKLKLANEYYQAILSFANIHEWPQLVYTPLTDHQDDFGFWRNIATDESINRRETSFPVFARSNSEKWLDESLPFTYACIQLTEHAQQHGIRFLANQYAGTTFDANLKRESRLAHREMQTLLLFVLTRFYFVEITGVDVRMLQQVSGVLTEAVLESIKNFRHGTEITSPLVYIEMPLQQSQSLDEISDLTIRKSFSVHVSGWEGLTQVELEARFGVKLIKGIKYGVTVQNCSHEMNLGLAGLRKLPFMKTASYLVCNVKPVEPRNFNQTWTQEYFGTLFYIKSFMEHFLSVEGHQVEVLFRINLVALEMGCREKKSTNFLLSFLNDMNQFSANYKIRYFIVRAFEKENASQECPISWWRLEDYSDLTNVSAYVDIEKEYFNLATQLRVPLPTPEINLNPIADEPSDTSIHWGIYILIGVLNVGALVLVVLFVVWVQRRCYKGRLLSRKEVSSFYNGTRVKRESMELVSSDYIDTALMTFSREHEMSAKDIQIQDVVGRGEFGVVHKGLYQNRVEVAIKIPKLDCGKDQFKSALSELKILCYVGSHPNIVSFLGAYTKEISKGKLLIVIEFCGKGSLESYLRSVQQAQPQQQTIGDVNFTLDLNQLYAFSYQIASGMEYVAEKRIIHGDLATRNVLLTSDFTCKISDFGLSRRIYEQGLYIKKGNEALPWMWMAPESLNFMEFTIKSDVWSFGVTLWEIFSLGKVPCPGMYLSDDYIMNLERGVRMGRAQFASEPLHQKMLHCWNLAQEERPTFTELKQYFANLGGHSYQNTSPV